MSRLLYLEDPTALRVQALLLTCAPHPEGGFLFELEETPFYPEGGGQPADHGWIGGVAIKDVQKGADDRVLHRAEAPLPPGPVEAQVDTRRRLDHSWQHSAQHLITALAQDALGLATTAFHLGVEASTIDLEGPLSPEDRVILEAKANAAIREARPVLTRVVSLEEYPTLPVRSRGLPAGHSGPVRLVEIEGIDLNTCGGTHVAHTGEIGAIHLSRVERHKGGSRLSFLAGSRVIDALAAAGARERRLTELLRVGPAEHAEAASRLLDQAREQLKAVEGLEEELATLLGERLAGSPEEAVALDRPTATLAQLGAIARAARERRPELRLLLRGEGVFLLAADPPVLAAVGAAVASALGGRGGGRGDRFQGKAPHQADLSPALALLAGA